MSSAHSPTFTVASPTSQLILQPFRRFTYVTAPSPTLPLHHLRYGSFSNPSFASPTSQALHLIHLANRPCPVHDIIFISLQLFYKQPKLKIKFLINILFGVTKSYKIRLNGSLTKTYTAKGMTSTATRRSASARLTMK